MDISTLADIVQMLRDTKELLTGLKRKGKGNGDGIDVEATLTAVLETQAFILDMLKQHGENTTQLIRTGRLHTANDNLLADLIQTGVCGAIGKLADRVTALEQKPEHENTPGDERRG